jgi:hypothetical protein
MNIRLETALVVLVPEAEVLTAPFRARHDPSAADGMPAHITLLYPFISPPEIDDSVLAGLRCCFKQFAAFPYSLGDLRRFPGHVLYLAPEPEEPFRKLTSAIYTCFPHNPPYGGRHRDIVPHLSPGQFVDARELEDAARAFAQAAAADRPITAKASSVSLMDTCFGDWRVRGSFALP